MHENCVEREKQIAAAWARAEDEVKVLKLQVRALRACLLARRAVEPAHSREDHDCSECDLLAAIKYTEKQKVPSPNCKCRCHEEIKKIGYGSPCGIAECAPCEVES